jgi:serine/threonine protein kinase
LFLLCARAYLTARGKTADTLTSLQASRASCLPAPKPSASPPFPPVGSNFAGYVAEAVWAAVPEATVYHCRIEAGTRGWGVVPRDTALALVLRSRKEWELHGDGMLLGAECEPMEWCDPCRPAEPPWFVILVWGDQMVDHLVRALWERNREDITWIHRSGPPHYTRDLVIQLVRRVCAGLEGLRVGYTTLEFGEVMGSGFFSLVFAARLVVAEGGEEGVIKMFVGQGARLAFENELNNLQMLTTNISPAALVVRLVGVMGVGGTTESVTLPWPALVMTPLCVESLEQRIDRFACEPYTLQEALAWAGQVALSLHCLHRESRLRHGDVTLRNVLLGRDGRAYLADMGVAEHNHPYGRQPQQERQGKRYSASVAPEMVAESPSSDARADVWSWGVLLHALLTRSTVMAKKGGPLDYLTMTRDSRWREETAAQWEAEGLPRGVFEAVMRSVCEREERMGLLTGAVLLGQQRSVEAMVRSMNAPEEVKQAELHIATVESSMGPFSRADGSSRADVLVALAASHEAVGDEAQAIACLRQVVGCLDRQASQADPMGRANVLDRLAVCLLKRGDYRAATALLEEALQLLRRFVPKDHPDIATSLSNLAKCHESQGEYGKAVLLQEEALMMMRRLLPEDHTDIASSLSNLANCYAGQGEYGKAVLLQEEALAMQRRLLPEDHPDLATSLNNLASCHYRQGKYGKAVLLHEEALAMQRRLLPEVHPNIATSLSNLANCHESQGEYDKAVLLQEEALMMQRRMLPEDHPDIARSLSNLASCRLRKGEYGKAAVLLEEALAMQRRVLREDHPDIARSLSNFARWRLAQGEYDHAVQLYEEALAMQRRVLPEDHPDIARSLHNIADSQARRAAYEKLLENMRSRCPYQGLQVDGLLRDASECQSQLWEAHYAGRAVVAKLCVRDPALVDHEASILDHVSPHPHIVKLVAFFAEPLPLLVTERLSHGDLGSYLTKPPPSQPPALVELVELVRQVADALAHVHSRGVLHADVKPANVGLNEEGGKLVAKLLDFGASRMLHDGAPTARTEGYTAPECLRGGPVSEKADVFSLGRLLENALRFVRGGCGRLRAAAEKVARACCEEEAGARPSARQVADQLGAILPLS